MTSRERLKIREAIKLLMGDECLLHEAIDLLGSMVGIRTAAGTLGRLRRVSIIEIAARPNQPFSVRRKGGDAKAK